MQESYTGPKEENEVDFFPSRAAFARNPNSVGAASVAMGGCCKELNEYRRSRY